MAEVTTNGRKLLLEICNARNLMPKDGQGTASAYVIIDYDGQRRRTSTIPRNLNPQWNETVDFVVLDPSTMAADTLVLNVYNDKKAAKRSNFLGKVKIVGSSFPPSGSQTLVYYPLEKRSVFSQIKGEIGLKVWYEDPPATAPEAAAEEEKKAESSAGDGEGGEKKTEEAEKKTGEEEKKGEEGEKKAECVNKDEKGGDDKKSPEENKQKGGGGEAAAAQPDASSSPAKSANSAPAPPPHDNHPPPIAQQANVREEMKQSNNTIVYMNNMLLKSKGDPELRSMSSRAGHTAFDLVDMMPFLYVRVVKAKLTASSNSSGEGECCAYAKLNIGTHTVKTKALPGFGKEWDQVFAFDKDGLNSTSLEVSVWTEMTVKKKKEVKEEEKEKKNEEKDEEKEKKTEEAGKKEKEKENKEKKKSEAKEEEFITVTEENSLGTVSFDLQEVPKRVPPDSPLAPQWYTLEGGSLSSSESADVMVAVWLGTQADETFQEAWQSDSGGLIPETRSKVYLSPKLWYLRLTVIQTQDLQLGSVVSQNKARGPELYVKAQLGPQVFKTCRLVVSGPTATSSSPTWNEDLIFVASEPFEPFLVVTVEDVTSGRPVGQTKVDLASMERRTDDTSEAKSRWFNLVSCNPPPSPQKDKEQQQTQQQPYAGRIHVRVCLEGGYHVLDEAAHVTSDVRPSAKQLAKPPMGMLEVGIRGANNLLPVKTRDGTCGTTDAYVVVKYGPKWVRTRTVLDRFNPRWNEQYTWDVYDPCTVLTIGVFDNGRYKYDESGKPGRDIRVGKVRVRLSTLDTNKPYFTTHALTVLMPGGARRMGEIEIALRFTCSSWVSLVQAYSSPMLPRMHYVCPMNRAQQDILRHTAMRIVTARLARSEPALGQEVVQYMLDSDTHVWSMRKSKVNWFRVAGGLSKIASLARWIYGIRTWAHPPTTVLVHIVLLAVVLCPHLILPTAFMYAFLILVLRVRYRGRFPLGVDPRLSHVDAVGPDELDEEFDGFPTTRPPEVIRVRYDRLRALAGKAQSFLGDMAAQWERVEALYNWKDPRATGIFVVLCLVASLVFYVVPFKAFVIGFGFYYLRHPKFRDDMPSVSANFFRRLPSVSDQLM